jgi:hypothetical protein
MRAELDQTDEAAQIWQALEALTFAELKDLESAFCVRDLYGAELTEIRALVSRLPRWSVITMPSDGHYHIKSTKE